MPNQKFKKGDTATYSASGHPINLIIDAVIDDTAFCRIIANGKKSKMRHRIPVKCLTFRKVFKFKPKKRERGSPLSNGTRAIVAQCCVSYSEIVKRQRSTPNTLFTQPPAASVFLADHDMTVDLLSDIAHLCDREGWDFDAMIKTVKMHH